MIKDFNISEKGHGSYWLLGILRWVMVLIFISFGIQKFTPQSADGIALYISNSPFVSWLSIFGIRGEAAKPDGSNRKVGKLLALHCRIDTDHYRVVVGRGRRNLVLLEPVGLDEIASERDRLLLILGGKEQLAHAPFQARKIFLGFTPRINNSACLRL